MSIELEVIHLALVDESALCVARMMHECGSMTSRWVRVRAGSEDRHWKAMEDRQKKTVSGRPAKEDRQRKTGDDGRH